MGGFIVFVGLYAVVYFQTKQNMRDFFRLGHGQSSAEESEVLRALREPDDASTAACSPTALRTPGEKPPRFIQKDHEEVIAYWHPRGPKTIRRLGFQWPMDQMYCRHDQTLQAAGPVEFVVSHSVANAITWELIAQSRQGLFEFNARSWLDAIVVLTTTCRAASRAQLAQLRCQPQPQRREPPAHSPAPQVPRPTVPTQPAKAYVTGRYYCQRSDGSSGGTCDVTTFAATCAQAYSAHDADVFSRGDVCRSCQAGITDNTRSYTGVRDWIHMGPCKQ